MFQAGVIKRQKEADAISKGSQSAANDPFIRCTYKNIKERCFRVHADHHFRIFLIALLAL